MIDQPPPTLPRSAGEDLSLELKRLSRGFRAFCAVVTCLITVFNLPLSSSIGKARVIFADMLPDSELPLLSQWVIQMGPLFFLLSLLLPVGALLVAFLVRRNDHALYAFTALIGYSLFQCVLIWTALMAPLGIIISQLNNAY